MSVDNALLATAPEALDQAIEAVSDPSVPMPIRGQLYANLRRLRLRIDRVLRPVTQEIELAMVAADAKDWGPLHLSWRSVDVKWPVNSESNWTDATAQSDLETWHDDAAYRPYLRSIPRHLEVDTAALGEAVHLGDPGAIDFWSLLKERRYRTDEGKAASLSVREGPG